jgi:6-phosphogluconolactonase
MGRVMSGRRFAAGGVLALLAMTFGGCSNYLLSRLLDEKWGGIVYVANQSDDTVSAFHVNYDTGALVAVPGSPFAAGNEPCAIATASGTFLYAANGGDNTLSGYRMAADTGALDPVPGSPFATDLGPVVVIVDASEKFVYVGNGNGNSINGYGRDAGTGALAPVPGSPYSTGTSAVRSFAVLNKFLYAAIGDGSVLAFAIDPGTGALTPVAGSPFGVGDSIEHVIAVSTGNPEYYLYGTTFDSKIAGFSIDWNTGVLSPLAGFPLAAAANAQSMDLYREGGSASIYLYIAHWDRTATTGSISTFSVAPATGALTFLDSTSLGSNVTPACIAVRPGKLLYVSSAFSGHVLVYSIDSMTGGLTEVAGSPFKAGAYCCFVAGVDPLSFY